MKVGFFGLLFIVLFTLKLIGIIHCSWFLVFLPLLIGFFLFFTAIVVAVLLALVK